MSLHKLVTRKQAGLRRPHKRPVMTPSDVKGIAVHHTVGATPRRHDDCAGVWRAIQQHHMGANGWADIAYNFGICPHGYTFRGRGWKYRSSANGGTTSNRHWFAVAVFGTNPVLNPTQLKSLRKIRMVCMVKFGYDARQAKPHSAFTSTACPGSNLRKLLDKGEHLL